jgi:hypothetical protein
MISDGDVVRCASPWPGTAARLLEGLAVLGIGAWHIDQICSATGSGMEVGNAAQVLAGLCVAGVCAQEEREDWWVSPLASSELIRLAQLLRGAEHYRRLRGVASSLELAVTMPLAPSLLERELVSTAGRPGGFLSTSTAFLSVARAATKRLVVLTPFLDSGGFRWLRRTLEGVRPEAEKIVILRDASNYAVELSIENADWLNAMNVSVRDYSVPHAHGSGRALPIETFHAKLLLADECLAYVGSANFLGSSEAVTLETGVLIDGSLASQVARLIGGVLRVARPV